MVGGSLEIYTDVRRPVPELASRLELFHELERQGMIKKLRGYVTAEPSSLFDSNVRYRMRIARQEKEAVARFALTQIEPGQSVMLEESTTALTVAKLLPGKAPLIR